MKDNKKKAIKKSALTRKRGMGLMIIGIAMQFLNMLTYGLWQIDIDILGAIIFLVGLVVTIVNWKVR